MIPAVISLVLVGFLFGGLLALAGQKFAVEEDPRIEEISELLSGANCGACGYAGCRGFAEAVVAGRADTAGCPVNSSEVDAQIAGILGLEVSHREPLLARVYCQGSSDVSQDKSVYQGIETCAAAAQVSGGGHKACADGCLGLGSCRDACPFHAISIVDGLAVIDPKLCTGCGKCVQSCPKGLIALASRASTVHVLCKNTDRGASVRKYCKVGCIGCRACVKVCPVAAVTVDDNLAKIDYDLCISCGACVEKCPPKCIVEERSHQAQAAS